MSDDSTTPTPPEGQNKILDFKKPESRTIHLRAANTNAPPLLNIPPVTATLIAVFLAIHVVLSYVLSDDQVTWIYDHLGFVPEKLWSNEGGGLVYISLFTAMFLHGSWSHVIMNTLMLAGFGSGVERWLGGKRMIAVFLLSGLIGAAFHYILNTGSPYPMIGASGGISGLFAAAILMMQQGVREPGGRFGILPFALIWIGLSIGFGMLGGPDGSSIAWAAHVGGFLGGFAVLKILRWA